MAQSAIYERQPLSPYRPGVTLDIQAHIPPPPFGRDYRNEDTIRRPVYGLSADKGNDRLDFALSHPPLETPPHLPTKSHVLTVLEKIDRRQERVSCYGGPHLVRCYLDSDESCHYVAKIYDGVNYPLSGPGPRGYDCMYRADQDYSREASAYQNIPLDMQGSIVPRYFGSWTFSVETGVCGLRRCVRMILLEHVDGECMLDMILRAKGVTQTDLPAELFDILPIDHGLLPPELERLDILAGVIEAEIMLLHAGIAHRDTAPRNVLISRSMKRVILIDFNKSRVYKCYESGRRFLESQGPNLLPISPIQRYWNSSEFVDEFGLWVPQSWLTHKDNVLNWLCTRWGVSTKFACLSKDFLSTNRGHPLLRRLSKQRRQETTLQAGLS